ncbi:hypothetical protein EsDP_00001553 [Epichloe bromicola]|uniref:Uncharacterized protein n=1 Tax=Epichloe bromicola TaxID=79588 RepID=A0ABQ0CI67_9HYPO
MAGKMFNLLTILVTLMGLASAQTQTTASGSTVLADITTMGGSADMSTAAASTATAAGAVNTVAASIMSNHLHHNQNTAAAAATTGPKIKFGLPTASNANPVRNAGRRPSQPGLRKLTIVVGLVTYGLILL